MTAAVAKPQLMDSIAIARLSGFTAFDVRWVPSSARIVAVGSTPRGSGVIQQYQLPTEGSDELQPVAGRRWALDAAVKCCTYGGATFAERHLAAGDHAGQLSVFDLEHSSGATANGSSDEYPAPTVVYSTSASPTNQIVNAIDGIGGLNTGGLPIELATASKDAVRVFDIRQQQPVCHIGAAASNASSSKVGRDSWSVAFGNSEQSADRWLAAGYDNGDLKVIDLRTMSVRWSTNLGNGVVGLQFDRKDIAANKLVATTLEGKVTVFDMRTYCSADGPGQEYARVTETAHRSTVWLARHLPQNRELFATLGGNGSMNLWKYRYPERRSMPVDTAASAAANGSSRKAGAGAGGEMRGVSGTLENLLPRDKKVAEQPIVGFDWHPEKLGLYVMCSLDQTIRAGMVTRLANV